MIGWLNGHIRELDPAGLVLLETHGVGYEVAVSMQTLCTLKAGDSVGLYIHSHVREDQFTLFGFATAGERAMFRKLTTVSGIGARMALNLMSGMPLNELTRAIDHGDDIAIARTPGIGKKTAQRLILELKGKLQQDGEMNDAGDGRAGQLQDVHSALINLGYKPVSVDKALKEVEAGSDFEAAFKQALKTLS